jgi:hypothetical protein
MIFRQVHKAPDDRLADRSQKAFSLPSPRGILPFVHISSFNGIRC